MAKRDKPKPYDSVEQALVEELGAVLFGTHVKIGEFLIEDGDGNDVLTAQAVDWLGTKRLLRSGASWAECFKEENEVTIYVYTQDGTTEYLFKVLPDGTLSTKRYHMVEASVFVPQKCECEETT